MLCKYLRGWSRECFGGVALPDGVTKSAAEWIIESERPVVEVEKGGGED